MIAPDASAPPIATAAGSAAHAGSRPAIAPTGSAKIAAPRSASLAASIAPYAQYGVVIWIFSMLTTLIAQSTPNGAVIVLCVELVALVFFNAVLAWACAHANTSSS